MAIANLDQKIKVNMIGTPGHPLRILRPPFWLDLFCHGCRNRGMMVLQFQVHGYLFFLFKLVQFNQNLVINMAHC